MRFNVLLMYMCDTNVIPIIRLPQLALVFDRKHTATKNKTGLLQIQIMYERRRKYISTGIKLFSDQWDDRRRVVNHPLAIEHNGTINAQLKELHPD